MRLTLGSGQSLVNVWNAGTTGTTGAVSLRNAAYNGAVGAGASTGFGFVADGSGSAPPGNVSCASP